MDNTINVCIPPCRLQKIVSYAYNFWCYYKQLFGLRNLWRLVPNALTSCLTFHISGNVSPRRRNIQRTAVKCWILRSLLCYSKRTFPYRFMPCRFGDSLCSTRSRNMASFIVSQVICAWRWMFLHWNAEFHTVYCAFQEEHFPIGLSCAGLATVCAVLEVEMWRPMLSKGHFLPEIYIRVFKICNIWQPRPAVGV